ncbi:stalk domain-containing protein [Paenibacillus sp. TAB 01]|uniref:stalk domain-containing protein n=1 Tax=Paenibacillus sp. TAB 01 TaxID=3368988 RepID=UPI0037502067
MKKLITGILIGSALTMSVTAFADSIKQYILTEVSYPLVVNGKEYKDAAAPILNYEGSTYVPLAKLGDITGVNYKWNDEAKRVEIVTAAGGTTLGIGQGDELKYMHDLSPEAAGQVTGGTPSGATLKPDTQVIVQKGLVQENGETVFYAYDKDDHYKGRFTDQDSAGFVIAQIRGDELPPTFAEGWIDAGFLVDVYGDVGYDNDDYVIRTAPGTMKQEIFYRFPLPHGFRDETNAEEITSNGVRLKKFDHGIFFNIADLQKAGILK